MPRQSDDGDLDVATFKLRLRDDLSKLAVDALRDRTLTRNCRIAFFDLDNTLIPTSWIMQRWRADENRLPHSRIVASINQALAEAGVFDAIDTLLTQTKKEVDRIIIVTNAGSRTVENFYLTHTLPQLKNILTKHNVQLTSTEEWVISLGPPPSPENEDAFREFYTAVKYFEFKRSVTDFLASEPLVGKNAAVDIISVGDQMCEISAACRLGDVFVNDVQLLKLVLILDPTNSRFSLQTPDLFVEQLAFLTKQVLKVIDIEDESTLDPAAWRKLTPAFLSDGSIRENVSYWVPQPRSLTYSVGRPGRFPTEFPFYLPLEYLSLEEDDLCEDFHRLLKSTKDAPSITTGDLTTYGKDIRNVEDEEELRETAVRPVSRRGMMTRHGKSKLGRGGACQESGSNTSLTETVTTADGQEEEELSADSEIMVL